MTQDVNKDVNIRVALSGQESWDSYRKAMADAKRITASLKRDLQEIERIGKAFEAKKIFDTPGGFAKAISGQQFKASQQAQRKINMGEEGFQNLAQAKENLRLTKELVKSFDSLGGVLAANQVKIGTKAATLQKITDITQAQNRLVGTEIRLAEALKVNDQARIADLSRQRDILKEHVALLQQRQKEASKPSHAEKSQMLRDQTRDRLFGDGGANLMAIQAGLSANYMILGGFQNALSGALTFTGQFDEALRNMQAISVVTDENMKGLKETILGVSQETRFFATEVADAALILGQAGFSVEEIDKSIEAVALLATATGTDLKQSVDIATSVIGVFNMESSQMGSVANTLTSAVNMSKLNIDKLALGLQYAGNTAAQSGVSFEELTAALGAMSNAGIRSGSTLGTGMRQILISLEKPSDNFKANLDRLGISMADIDLRANGLYGVMKNLKDGGFSAADAIQSFEVRAAAAFNALSGNIEDVVALERAFLNQTSAMQANETQMRAVLNQWRRFQSNLQVVVSTGLEPLTYALRDVLSGLSSFLEGLREHPTLLRVATTALVSMAAAAGVTRLAFGAWNLLGIATGLRMFTGAAATATAGTAALGTAATAAGVATRSMLGPIGWGITALSLGITAWSAYADEVANASSEVQKAQTAFDDANGAIEQTTSEIAMVEGKIKELSDRARTLTENQNLLQLETDKVRSQFKEMGIDVSETTSTVGELIESLIRLQGELSKKYVLQIETSKTALDNLIEANKTKIKTLAESIGDNRGGLSRLLGVYDPVTEWATNPYMGLQDQGNLMLQMRKADQNTLDQNQSLLAQAGSVMDLLQAQKASDPNWKTNSQQDQALSVLENYFEVLKQIVELQALQVSQQRQLNDLATQGDNAQNRLANPQVNDRVLALTNGARARVIDATAGIEKDPIREFDAANAEMTKIEAEAEQLKKEIRDNTNLNLAVQEAMIQEIDNALADADKLRDQLLETAQDVAKDNADLRRKLSEVQASRLETQLEKAPTGENVDYITAKRYGLVNENFASQKEELRVKSGGDETSASYQAGLAEITAQRDAENARIREDYVNAIGVILERDAAAIEGTLADLELKLQGTSERDYQARREIFEQMEATIIEKAEAEEAVAIAGIENIADRTEELKTIRRERDAALLGVAQQQQANDLAEAQQALEETDAALEQVALLAVKTTSLAQLVALMKRAMTLLATRARQARAVADADPNDNITPGSVDLDQEKILEDWRQKEATWRTNIGKYGNAGGKKFGSGGGGGGGGKAKSEAEKMLEQMEARVKSVEALLKAELLDSTTGVGTINGIITDAKKKVSELDSKIAAMQSKVNGGQMNEKDLEALNDLLKAREGLTKAAAEAEAMLTREMIKQGDYWGAAKNITLGWAKENLDITKTFTSGVEGVLSSLTSGFAELFTSLANSPKQAGSAFRQFAIMAIQAMQKMIAQMLAVYAMQKLIGMVFNGPQAPGSLGAVAREAVGLPMMVGGAVRKATGGMVEGNLPRDSKLHKLMPGEYVLRKSAVDMIGVDALDDMNAMGNRKMAQGGHFGAAKQDKGALGMTNVYVVSPDQKPVPGPGDIIAIINDDIARGGSTKKLIKSVAMGY